MADTALLLSTGRWRVAVARQAPTAGTGPSDEREGRLEGEGSHAYERGESDAHGGRPGHTRRRAVAPLLDAFRRRVGNTPATEFREALDQVHRIARLRLQALAEETP